DAVAHLRGDDALAEIVKPERGMLGVAQRLGDDGCCGFGPLEDGGGHGVFLSVPDRVRRLLLRRPARPRRKSAGRGWFRWLLLDPRRGRGRALPGRRACRPRW